MIRGFLKKQKYTVLITAVLFLAVVFGALSYGWLAGSGQIPCDVVDGSVLTQYFHCGNGSEENPFVITRPIHYYNLVYLYQRKEGFADQGYYFQLGYDLQNNGTYVFYDYSDTGAIIEDSYSTELNLACYNEANGNALLPIGTSVVPFKGTFSGNGLTVSNLSVSSAETILGSTYETCDVGIFGYVDGSATIENVYFENVTILLSGANPLAECAGNPSVHDTAGDPAQDMVYVGYLAGHVKTTTSINDVYVNDCEVVGGSLANCNFGFFGCIEDVGTGKMVQQLGSHVATLRGAGKDAGFGGSLDMKNLYTRIKQVLGNGTTSGVSRDSKYPTSETILIPENASGTPTVTVNSTANIGNSDYGTVYSWFTPQAGRYVGSASGSYTYLYGLKSTQTTSTVLRTKSGTPVDAWLISYDGLYLCVANGAVSNTTLSSSNAAKWMTDGDNKWYTFVGETRYYLNANGTTGVRIQNVAATNATVWSKNANGSLSTTVGGVTYYLIYQNGAWILSSNTTFYRISDGNGNYLTGTASGVQNTTNANGSVKWQVTHSGDTYHFSAVIGGTRYYLGNSADRLTMGTTDVAWTRESTAGGDAFYRTVAGEKFYLIYDGEWRLSMLTGFKISNASHYLTAATNGTVSDTTTESSAVIWQFSAETGDTQIYTVINGNRYYLTYDGNLGLKVSTTVPTVLWHRSGSSFYYTHTDGNDYYLQCSHGYWVALPLQSYTIRFGGKYLVANGATSFGETTSVGNATRFYFSTTGNQPQGTIRFLVSGVGHILGNNNGSFADRATTWVRDGNGRLYVSGSTYYLAYEKGWKIKNCPENSYLVSDGNGNYLSANIGISAGLTRVQNSTDVDTATRWTFTNTGANPSGKISTPGTLNIEYFLIVKVSESGGGCGGESETTYSLEFDTGSQPWTNTNGVLLCNSRYLVFNGSWTISETAGAALKIERDLNGTAMTVEGSTDSAPALTVTNVGKGDAPAVAVSDPISETLSMVWTETEEQVYVNSDTVTTRRSSYIPIRVAEEGEEDYDANSPYAVSKQNTGYIVGGTYSAKSGSGQGDIRVSSYGLSNIGQSYNNTSKAFTKLYTYNGGGSPVEITDSLLKTLGYSQYENVCKKFLEILQQDTSNVSGLHFMNSEISISHIIQAEYATVFGKSYVNYDLPESCIDFNIVQSGYITFMAGDYYDGNNAFFSLHQVFRLPGNQSHITDIKEISRIYKKTVDGDLSPYIYVYSDGTYTNTSGKYYDNDGNVVGFSAGNVADACTAVEAQGYSLAFNSEWITNPSNGTGTINNKYIYYFEMPCNVGEYALGSVSGKTGAYLLYLDIGANGGAIMESIVSSEGNETTEQFCVDFRSAPEKTDWSIIQLFYNAPEVTGDTSKFSIRVSFDPNDTGGGKYPSGCYHVDVVNNTSTDVTVYVYLCDNNDDPSDEFPYAYQITYRNANHTGPTLIQRGIGSGTLNYWKAVAGFRVPASGDATEVVYG